MPDKPKKRKPTNATTFVKAKLRSASVQWKPRYEALKLSRKERGLYQCAMCQKLFKSNQVHVDHIEPVVPLNANWPYGTIDWNVYISRLFCTVDKLQVLCEECHKIKTELENEMRNYYNIASNSIKNLKIPKINVDKKKKK
jgi:5-methylcytosine-specific restriction endonuclease McrA